MANAILLNQSTELTKENILSQLSADASVIIKIDKTPSGTVQFSYTILTKDGENTETIDFTDGINNLITNKLTNYITYDDPGSYEAVTS